MFGDPFLNEMGWEKLTIQKVLIGKPSNGYFVKRDDYIENGNVKILGVADIVNRMFSKTDNLPSTNVTSKDIEKYKVNYGDLLFCRSSLVAEGIGKASIVSKHTEENILFECHVIRLQLDLKKCIPEFIQMLTESHYFRNQILKHAKTSTMTTISQDGILKSEIILPPLALQNQFADFVAEVDKSQLAGQMVLKLWRKLLKFSIIKLSFYEK